MARRVVSRRTVMAGAAGAAALAANSAPGRAQDGTEGPGGTPGTSTGGTPMVATPAPGGRDLPAWYADAKLGIFVHWGLYSVPGWAPTSGPLNEVVAAEGWPYWFANNPYAEWYRNSMLIPGSPTQTHHRATFGPGFAYEGFMPLFDGAAQGWDPAAWADLFAAVGARYVVLTTKHHDGYTLWPSGEDNRALGSFPSRDLVGDLAAAVRAAGLRFGAYYSGGLDWTSNGAVVRDLPDLFTGVPTDPAYARYVDRHWRELIERYQPSVLWNDLGSPAGLDVDRLFADYYAAVPDGVVNDRFRLNPDLSPGAPYDFRTAEYSPDQDLSAHAYEATRGIGFSFGYNRNEDEASFIPVPDLVRFFVDTVSKNGNLLLNVGPTAEGEIPAGQRERLEGLGTWLATNGEAIYGTRPWVVAEGREANGTPIRFTRNDAALYATLLGAPRSGALALVNLRAAEGTEVRILGQDGPLVWQQAGSDLKVQLDGWLPDGPAHSVRISPVPEWIG